MEQWNEEAAVEAAAAAAAAYHTATTTTRSQRLQQKQQAIWEDVNEGSLQSWCCWFKNIKKNSRTHSLKHTQTLIHIHTHIDTHTYTSLVKVPIFVISSNPMTLHLLHWNLNHHHYQQLQRQRRQQQHQHHHHHHQQGCWPQYYNNKIPWLASSSWMFRPICFTIFITIMYFTIVKASTTLVTTIEATNYY